MTEAPDRRELARQEEEDELNALLVKFRWEHPSSWQKDDLIEEDLLPDDTPS